MPRACFFNIRLETGKTELIHAVIEGTCYHLRWMLERQDRKLHTSDPIRFVGGGALSPVTCQRWRISRAGRSRWWPIPRTWARWARRRWSPWAWG